jgi:hypothetical protein
MRFVAANDQFKPEIVPMGYGLSSGIAVSDGAASLWRKRAIPPSILATLDPAALSLKFAAHPLQDNARGKPSDLD